MTLLFVFTDVISILLSILLAILVGGRFGDEFSPNVLVLAISFILARSLLFWLLFRSVVRRDLSWMRDIFQSIFLIISLSFVAFILTTIPTYLISPDSEFAEFIFLFTDAQGTFFYFLAVPGITLILSAIIHRFYKLEPW